MRRKTAMWIVAILCAAALSACGNADSQKTEEEQSAAAEEETAAEEEIAAEENTEETAEVPEGSTEITDDTVFGEFTAIAAATGDKVTQEIFAEADLTMVNIWGTFCGPCLMEMPDLGEISDEYEGTGFQIVGIITDIYEYGDETVDEIVESTGADYTHLLLSIDLYNNYLSGVQVVPTTVFVDSEGKEIGIYTGSKSKDDWIEIIEEMREKVSARSSDEATDEVTDEQ